MARRDSVPPLLASLVSAASGLSVGFAFWPYRTGFIAYFVLVPFIIFSGLRDGRRWLVNTLIFGFCYFIGSLYWIAMLDREQIAFPWLRIPAAVVLCLYLSLFVLLAGLATRRLVLARVPFEIAFAVAWGGVEYLRSLGPLGFPWASLGYSQTSYPVVVQQAAVIGIYGISAWLVLLNALVARVILTRRARTAIITLAVFAVPVVGGALVLAGAECRDSIRLSLVQPNIGGSVKWDAAYRDSTMEILTEMTRATRGSEMVIWPETAVPVYAKHTAGCLDSLAAVARSAGAYILTGFPDYELTGEGPRYYNSAMLVSPAGQVTGEYRKIHLVPFGEMIPFEDRLAFLRNINFGEGDFSPGKTYEVFTIGSRRFGVAICFEAIYPSLVRRFVGNGGDFIVNITNDEWFGRSAGPHQHAEMAVMRCVESRVALARCANTGLSMLVDPYGRVTGRTELFTRGTLTGELALTAPGTPYSRWGYIFELMLILLPAIGWALPWLRRRPGRAAKPEAGV
jgi:apolipoprotein N-acyltransferase